MKKRIWIVNYYTSAPDRVSNPRYIELARHFMDAGYDVITFNASYNDKLAKDLEKSGKWCYFKDYDGFKFGHVKTPHYVGNGLKRMWSILVFALKMWLYAKRLPRPDVVLHNLHTPFDYPVMWAARRTKAKYIAEAWDLWPEDFVTFGLVGENNPGMKVFYWLEHRLYRKADALVFTQEGALDYLRHHGWTDDKGGNVPVKKVHYINNGVNLDEFDSNVKKYPRNDKDLNDENLYKIIYMGSIRLVNNVKQLIEAAVLLKNNPKYRFLIYGDGSDREMLEQYVKEHHIENVVFKEKRIPLCEVANVVSHATVNIMNYQKKFGLHGVSSGKMFQYMAAGKPICCNIKLNYSEISRNNLGIDEELDTPQQYADAIQKLAEQPKEEYEAMCQRVRDCAEKFDYKILAKKELDVIKSVL